MIEARRLFGDTWRDIMDVAEDAARAHRTVDALSDACGFSYEQRSRFHGRVRYLMARAEHRRVDIDVEGFIDHEIAAEANPWRLHGTDSACRIDGSVGNETDLAIADLEARVKAMRSLGVVRWAGIELGPVLASEPSEEDATQRSLALEQKESERRKRLQFAASGGPRRPAVRT